VKVSIIVAMTRDRVIGRGGGMPWHLPADLARFKSLTMGKPIIVGRKTFESIGRLLPGRRHIIVSRNPEFHVNGAEVVAGLDAALEAAASSDEAFVIGGVELFREALARADRIYMTLIHSRIEGDVYFPEFDNKDWQEVECTERAPDGSNPYRLTFLLLDRR
jgi:dihydrofolate reductase